MSLRILVSFMTIAILFLKPVSAFAVTAQLPAGCTNIVSELSYTTSTETQNAIKQKFPQCFPPNQGSGVSAKTGIQQLLSPFSVGIARVQAALSKVSISIFFSLVVFTVIVTGVKIAFGSAPPALGALKTGISIAAVYALVNIGPSFLDGLFAYAQGQGDMVGAIVLQGIKQSYSPGHGGLINQTAINKLPNVVSMDAGNILEEGIQVAVQLSASWLPKHFSVEALLELLPNFILLATTAFVYIIIFAIAAIEAAWLVIETNLIVMLSSIVFAISVLEVYRSHLNKIIEVMVKQCIKVITLYAVLALGYAISQAAINQSSIRNGSFNSIAEMIGIAIMYGIIVLRANKLPDIVFSGTTGSAMTTIMAMFNTGKAANKSTAALSKDGKETLGGKIAKGGAALATGGASKVAQVAAKGAKAVGKAIKGGSQEEKANVPGPNTVDSKNTSPPPGKASSQNSPGNTSIPPASFNAPKNASPASPPSSSTTPPPSSGGKSSPGPELKKEKQL